MSKQFFPNLSQNYIGILEDDEYYDITIEVGEDPNVKIFRAHMIILCYRSPFLRRTLSSNKKNDNSVLAHIKFSNISPEIFQIILRYIYGGIISLNEQEPSEILKVLVAADQLFLKELIDYLQKYLIENKSEWMEQYFEHIYRTSSQSNSLLELQQYCIDFMAKSPEKIFKSLDFTSLSEKSLVSLIKRDDLQIKEVEVWEHVLKWGLGKNPTLLPDPTIWSDDDFKTMENTLQHCLPLVRFFSLSSDDFFQKVRPYKKLLGHQTYEELLESYLNPDSEPNDNILLSRYRNIGGIIDSKIVNLNIVSLISRWIDNDIGSKFAHTRELYLPYEFKLLLRGSRDGFTPKKFHELCDGIPHTVTFIKIGRTEEIIGGYNPLEWKSSGGYCKTKDSFIFSFKNKVNFKDLILSRVDDASSALFYKDMYGPTFSNDICLYVKRKNDGSKDYEFCRCKQSSYKEKLRNTEDYFSIEDYEVFQIKKKDDNI
ncbi:uncharacterized protein OCT59_029156 [Rhizophagus irregularis]|uniref:Serine-enriched protein n=2 Tax=Rhizophagus irregularis TaxID=588596 RepID=A0A015JG72_RHIIW|nr:hypothetical protein GLOIN_2v1779084 [Rhizophagus irregularis DAOM 181602=DAOM 197198]EXX68517.1 hypothetical protein RirG_104530 [Rhizophagus irregularis DAOM 197198w]POG67710.1 hypothetical protein GLOIN_2v1779084 [Rhizophagus irregularis DAOM 181602=DAOM 197198]UZO08913.1 hypothetical protein OCT59_029156 [Rhizophagus irregularis]|eukprot:XP_025174576.1 hypothetical protein GLOIN_2v1779084 [Rhizophagus irregularis DAOM 181602=DAOM 197198]